MPGTNPTVSEVVARPARTLVQMTPAAVITEFVDAFFYDLSQQQYAALFAFLTLLFSFLQTAYENAKGKGFLRRVPPVQVPVVDGQPAPKDPA